MTLIQVVVDHGHTMRGQGHLHHKPPILVTNDDGVEALGLLSIVAALHSAGHPVLVVAPRGEQSASGMRLTLRKPLRIESHVDLEAKIANTGGPPLSILSVEGTPCDSVIVALEGSIGDLTKGIRPVLCVSGVNLGPKPLPGRAALRHRISGS